MGTAVGTQVFIKYGWRPAAALSVAWSGFTLVVMLVRGPHCDRHTWFGYEGGCELRKSRVVPPQTAAGEDGPRGRGEEDLDRQACQGTTSQAEQACEKRGASSAEEVMKRILPADVRSSTTEIS